MISVRQAGYRVVGQQILRAVSFEARQGEVLAIIGANGAGKSTLLKLLSGELQPSAGQIMLDNIPVTDYHIRHLARRRAVLTQQHTVSLAFTVKELVLMGRYPHFERQPSAHDVQVVAQAMQTTGISHMAARRYDTLSGGEQQRVQLARVMAQILDMGNAWLFLDEPTNGLDLLHQQQLLMQARQLADRGFGVICILHDINHAAAYADKLLVLKHGTQLAFGAPEDVITPQLMHDAFGVHVKMLYTDELNHPLVVATGGIYQH